MKILMIFFMLSLYLMIMNIITWMMSIIFILKNMSFMIEWNLMNIKSMKMIYIIYIDWMSLIFISTVLLISSMVIMYSIKYMENDLFIKRFMMLILTFIMSMIFMIISPNLISILLGWDGLGLSSYCLVAYFSSKKSFNSSMITILMNRIGDIMILIMISLMLLYGSWNIMFINKMNMIMMFLIMTAAITKSAQIPFSSWLPMAMAAPTPVSSLVHSSTLVTAGIYLLIRFMYLFNENFLYFLMILSLLTMIMASTSAILEFDMKKIIALSTLSQLSIMMMTISLKLNKLAFFHLITHAMFKSLLFLCSGIIIHNSLNNQDIRFISMLNKNMPIINLTFNIASLTLCGMPFLSGFYSKDLIIEMFLMKHYNWLMFSMMYLSMMMTTIYTFRMIFYLTMKNLKINLNNLYTSYNLMNKSIIILIMMTLFYGSYLNWILFSSMNIIYLPKNIKILIFYIIINSIILSLVFNNMNLNMFNKKSIKIMTFINYMWLYTIILKKNKMNLNSFSNKLNFYIEMKWSEYLINNFLIFYMKLIFKFKMMNKLNFMSLMFMCMMFILYTYIM